MTPPLLPWKVRYMQHDQYNTIWVLGPIVDWEMDVSVSVGALHPIISRIQSNVSCINNSNSHLVIGISKLADQLEIDPLEDIRILVLLYKLGAKSKPAQISLSEWTSGCEKLQADSIEKFKMLLPSLDLGFMERSEFREFHKVSRSTYFTEFQVYSYG